MSRSSFSVRLPGAGFACASVLAALLLLPAPARAESLREALADTYRNNPELSAARAELRAIDENVPQALSGYRPQVFAGAEASQLHSRTVGVPPTPNSHQDRNPRGFGITVTQPVFSGFRTLNSTRQADALVKAGRESLLNTEQNVLLSGVEAYMNVLRDRSIVELRRNNVKVLREQLRATSDRFQVGEVTRTDTAQAEAALSLSMSNLNLAQANLDSSEAIYEQIIGKHPGKLAQPPTLNGLLPKTLADAQLSGDGVHPAIQTAEFNELAASYGVDVTTGELLPTVSIEGSYSRDYDPGVSVERSESTIITGRIDVPIYQGGSVSSRVRQAKQVRGQRRIELELVRRQVRAAVNSAWGQYDAAKARIVSAQSQTEANKVALAGVREEANVGQRTTLDVLDAQQALLDAQVEGIVARRDLVVAAYALASAVGRLTAERLNLAVQIYDPYDHYLKVRGKWFGLGD